MVIQVVRRTVVETKRLNCVQQHVAVALIDAQLGQLVGRYLAEHKQIDFVPIEQFNVLFEVHLFEDAANGKRLVQDVRRRQVVAALIVVRRMTDRRLVIDQRTIGALQRRRLQEALELVARRLRAQLRRVELVVGLERCGREEGAPQRAQRLQRTFSCADLLLSVWVCEWV